MSRATARADVERAVSAARSDRDTLDRHNLLVTLAWWCAAFALVALAAALALLVRGRRDELVPTRNPARELVRS